MEIPLYVSAIPSRAGNSALIKLFDGEWVIVDDCVDTKVHIITHDDPLTILSKPRFELPLVLTGPCYVIATISHRGTEKHINVKAVRQ